MLMRASPDPMQSPAYRTGAMVHFGALVVILTALAFQHFGGYAPCPLCLQQRYAYYAAIPTLFLALVLVAADRRVLAALLFVAVCASFLANAGLGIYHAGAEWKFWAGPDTCAAVPQNLSSKAGELFERLGNARVIRCDEAPWRLFGLSFAGWNVLASLVLAAGAAAAALDSLRRSI